jgi:hypothetical protein
MGGGGRRWGGGGAGREGEGEVEADHFLVFSPGPCQ